MSSSLQSLMCALSIRSPLAESPLPSSPSQSPLPSNTASPTADLAFSNPSSVIFTFLVTFLSVIVIIMLAGVLWSRARPRTPRSKRSRTRKKRPKLWEVWIQQPSELQDEPKWESIYVSYLAGYRPKWVRRPHNHSCFSHFRHELRVPFLPPILRTPLTSNHHRGFRAS